MRQCIGGPLDGAQVDWKQTGFVYIADCYRDRGAQYEWHQKRKRYCYTVTKRIENPQDLPRERP